MCGAPVHSPVTAGSPHPTPPFRCGLFAPTAGTGLTQPGVWGSVGLESGYYLSPVWFGAGQTEPQRACVSSSKLIFLSGTLPLFPPIAWDEPLPGCMCCLLLLHLERVRLWGRSSWKTRRAAIMGTAYSNNWDCSAADRGACCLDNKHAKVSVRCRTIHSAVWRVLQYQRLALGHAFNQNAVQGKQRC